MNGHGFVKFVPPPGWLMDSIRSSQELLQGDTLSPVQPPSARDMAILESMLPGRKEE